jgi:RND family efflux transporter MFP subunit
MTASVFRHPRLLAAIAVLAVALLGWWLFPSSSHTSKPQAVPVIAGKVSQRDVPVWLTGVGSAQSLHSVTLRPQIDGTLTDVLFREGQTVKKGQLLAKIDDRAIVASLQQAQAEKARNEAQLKVAELDLVRYQNLLKDDAVPRQTLEQQHALVAQVKATLAANVASIAAAEVQLSYTRITSPVSGRVGMRRVDPGNLVRASDSTGLVTVTQINPIAVVFSLPQQHLSQVQQLLTRNAANVPVIAFDRDLHTELARGKLGMVDNAVDAATGTIRLKAEFANADGKLWPGQFVSVRLLIDTRANAIVVDSRAVRQGLEGNYVFRIEDSKAKVVRVDTLYEDDNIAVVGGLAAGDLVIVDGYMRVADGSAVNVSSTQALPDAEAADAATRKAPPTNMQEVN